MTPENFRMRHAAYSPEKGPDSPENGDVLSIWKLLSGYAEAKLLLPRTKEDIAEKIANFRIAEVNGIFAGCVALRNYGNGLYEIRSLSVVPSFAGRGIGTAMVEFLLDTMRNADGGAVRLFSLTYRTRLFTRLGFRIVDKSMFPDKIWSDCVICTKKDHCDETAVLLELPS